MSDQGSVNPAFNAVLKELRESVLATAIDSWETLSQKTKEDIREMSNFFCKMHIVVNFATESDMVLKIFESNVAEGRNPHAMVSQESGAVRLTRTACKAFTAHGCDKAGVSSYWESFLEEKDKVNKMVTFRGNRFNIAFYDGGAVYYHREDIREFLLNWCDPNSLLESINFDVNEPVFLAGVRALGIIDQIVTGPYWRLLEQEGCIYDTNEHLLHMKQAMEQWATDASPVLNQTALFDEDKVKINKDDIYDALFAETDPVLESLTQLALEVLFSSLLIILERQAQDNLPGGKYWNPSKKSIRTGSTCTKNKHLF